MAIGAESLQAEANIRKLAKQVATDCSVFDQYACASPHTIFVERGGGRQSQGVRGNVGS